jgi:hypothetical protein
MKNRLAPILAGAFAVLLVMAAIPELRLTARPHPPGPDRTVCIDRLALDSFQVYITGQGIPFVVGPADTAERAANTARNLLLADVAQP